MMLLTGSAACRDLLLFRGAHHADGSDLGHARENCPLVIDASIPFVVKRPHGMGECRRSTRTERSG